MLRHSSYLICCFGAKACFNVFNTSTNFACLGQGSIFDTKLVMEYKLEFKMAVVSLGMLKYHEILNQYYV